MCTIFEDKAYTFADGLKGGFPSVCARGVALHCGAVYFELNLFSEGCMQVGWVDASFTGDVAEVLFIGISFSDFFSVCRSGLLRFYYQGNGVGDDLHSWSFDGYRKLKVRFLLFVVQELIK